MDLATRAQKIDAKAMENLERLLGNTVKQLAIANAHIEVLQEEIAALEARLAKGSSAE